MEEIIWRLLLECGHYALIGPWPTDDDEARQDRHMIGDIKVCEICPKVPDRTDIRRMVLSSRTVVKTEWLPASEYRDPSAKLSKARHHTIYH